MAVPRSTRACASPIAPVDGSAAREGGHWIDGSRRVITGGAARGFAARSVASAQAGGRAATTDPRRAARDEPRRLRRRSRPRPEPPAPPPPPRAAAALGRLEHAWAEPLRGSRGARERTRGVADEIGVASLDPLARALLFGSGSIRGRRSSARRGRGAAGARSARSRTPRSRERASGRRRFAAAAQQRAPAPCTRLPRISTAGSGSSTTGWLLAALRARGRRAPLPRGARHRRRALRRARPRRSRSSPRCRRSRASRCSRARAAARGARRGRRSASALGLVRARLWSVPSREQRIAVALAALLSRRWRCIRSRARGRRELAALGADPTCRGELRPRSPASSMPSMRCASTRAAGTDAEPADDDPLALSALAQWKRRAGDLAAADTRYYEQLLAGDDTDVRRCSSNAAEREDRARRSGGRRSSSTGARSGSQPSAVLWFNLVAGPRARDRRRAARPRARRGAVARPGRGERADRRASPSRARLRRPTLPLSQQWLRERMLDREPTPGAPRAARALAPGWLGRSLWIARSAPSRWPPRSASRSSARFEPSVGCLDCGTASVSPLRNRAARRRPL